MSWQRASHADLPAIQAWLEADAATWTVLEGAPPRPDEAHYVLTDIPPGFDPARKHLYLVDDIALVDVLVGYPDERTWYLGLIYVVPAARSGGSGSRILAELYERVRAGGGAALRLAVVVENVRARRLYDRLGFAHVARRTRTTWRGAPQDVDVLELAL